MRQAISPLDGRYEKDVDPLRPYFTEEALMRARVRIEVLWLMRLSQEEGIPAVPEFSPEQMQALGAIIEEFSQEDFDRIKVTEQRTRHDVKAVEYFVREKIRTIPELGKVEEFVHFALTSEDVNNLAYGELLEGARLRVLIPVLRQLWTSLAKQAEMWKDVPLLSLTHGQPATPTTVGKEFRVFADRLDLQLGQLGRFRMQGKFGGAVGNYAAHYVAYPDVAWKGIGRDFVERLDLLHMSHTTQINPHDDLAELSHLCIRINAILQDLAQDMWFYISRGVFKLKVVQGEVGSSTMPHKVNPIDFENAEGNAGMANAMFEFFGRKLPISRMQRDLSDSTVQRSLGSAFGYTLLAWKSAQRGLGKIELDRTAVAAELRAHPEVLAEAIQTVLRKYVVPAAYERLKELTRGRAVSWEEVASCIQELPIDDGDRARLLALCAMQRGEVL